METIKFLNDKCSVVKLDDGNFQLSLWAYHFQFDAEAMDILTKAMLNIQTSTPEVEEKVNFTFGGSLKEITPGVYELDLGNNTIVKLGKKTLDELIIGIQKLTPPPVPNPLKNEIKAIEAEIERKKIMLDKCTVAIAERRGEYDECVRDKEDIQTELTAFRKLLDTLKNK